ncbi:MAG TPA: hypothetical protein VF622_11080 [Segetibacter sp.]
MSWLSNMFDRVNITPIYKSHLTTFYHYEKQKFYNKQEIPGSDKLLFGVLPIVLTVMLCISGLEFTKDYVDIILTCLSIFIGLLFGLLTMVYGLVQENQKIDFLVIDAEDKRKLHAKVALTADLFKNIAFSIVLSIFAIVLVLLTQFRPSVIIDLLHDKNYYPLIKSIFLYLTNGISFFLLIEFVLVLMMIIRRFMVLFLNQMSFPTPVESETE